MKTIVHVNQHVIRANGKSGRRDPVLTVKTYKSNEYAHEVDIHDAQGNVVATVVYRPDKPLSCGAKVWIATEHEVSTRVHGNVPEEEGGQKGVCGSGLCAGRL